LPEVDADAFELAGKIEPIVEDQLGTRSADQWQ